MNLGANDGAVETRAEESGRRGQVDNEGTPHRISLVAEAIYDIEYETNLPGIDVLFGADQFALVIERNNVPVNEIQVLHVDRNN